MVKLRHGTYVGKKVETLKILFNVVVANIYHTSGTVELSSETDDVRTVERQDVWSMIDCVYRVLSGYRHSWLQCFSLDHPTRSRKLGRKQRDNMKLSKKTDFENISARFCNIGGEYSRFLLFSWYDFKKAFSSSGYLSY